MEKRVQDLIENNRTTNESKEFNPEERFKERIRISYLAVRYSIAKQ